MDDGYLSRTFSPVGELLFFVCLKNKSPKEMHPSFRLIPALLVKTSARETRPGSSQKA
jgi:hypothetical protein